MALVLLSLAAVRSTVAMDLDGLEKRRKAAHLPNGEVISYAEYGDPSGAAIVLIHGYTDNARDWVPMLPFMPRRYHLILPDLRGHGHSGKPECCYGRLDFAYDIKLLMDALHVQKADIIGHSLGSVIAQTFAEYWPERTSRVVLISSTGGTPPSGTLLGGTPPSGTPPSGTPPSGTPPSGTPPRAASSKSAAADFVAQIDRLHEPLDPDSPFMIAWWDSPTPVDPEFIRRQRQDAARIPLRVWRAVLDQGLHSNDLYADLQRDLPRLKAPTLLIWGSIDPIMDEAVRQTLRDALPRAQVKIFDGLGHNPFWENPAEVAGVIAAFLQRTD
jgi:pimeloyl-ACP methyl ester carboxylesterase